jgi:hypothetical protein
MKRYLLILTLTGLLIAGIFVLGDSNRIEAQESIRFFLQVSAFPSLAAAQKEIERLKSLDVTARYITKEDQTQKKWVAVYIDHYATREEAARQGNQLIQKGVIQTFFIFPKKVRQEEPLEEKIESPPPKSLLKPPQKELKPPVGKTPIFFGPIVIKEEDATILMTIGLDRKVFPKITTQKNGDNSRLFVTFNNIDKVVVPVDFRKDQNRALLSFRVDQKGRDCTFILVLNPSFNYEVSQNYFEKEKIYSLRIRWESTSEPIPVSEK